MYFKFKIISALLIANVYFLLVESQDELKWGFLGRAKCDMRYSNDANKYACIQWPSLEMKDDPDFMRVFTIVTALSYNQCVLGSETYRCANLQPYYAELSQWAAWAGLSTAWTYNYEKLAAERILFGNFYLISRYGEPVLRGQFGPLFVRSPVSQIWTESDKIPGFYKAEGGAKYYFFKYFIPYVRTDTKTPENDQVLMDWQDWELKKRDFEVEVSLQGTCRYSKNYDFNCISPLSSTQRTFMHSFVPQTDHKLSPILKETYLDLEKFHFELTEWEPSNKYIKNEDFYGHRAFGGSWDSGTPAMLQFVLYDSNPAPHGHCDDENSRWNQKNGEVRAVFAQFSAQLYGYKLVVSAHIYRTMMGRVYDIALTNQNWNENRLKFLAEWQKNRANTDTNVQPLNNTFIDDRDMIWYKNWTRTNGMSVAFTLCSSDIIDITTRPARANGCMEYMHFPVEIRGREWLL